jgi:hypothetical protein
MGGAAARSVGFAPAQTRGRVERDPPLKFPGLGAAQANLFKNGAYYYSCSYGFAVIPSLQ